MGALLLEPRGRLLGLRRVGVLNDGAGPRRRRRRWRREAAEIAAGAQVRRAGDRGPRGAAADDRVLAPARVRRVRPQRQPAEHAARCCRSPASCRPPRTPAPSASGWRPCCAHGDLVILTGDLGAGKTTLTQGIGEGLGVRGGVTSPTFVISRVHPSLDDGPPLIHVDAYRLGGVGRARRPRPRHRRRSTPSRSWSGARAWPRRSRSTGSSSPCTRATTTSAPSISAGGPALARARAASPSLQPNYQLHHLPQQLDGMDVTARV